MSQTTLKRPLRGSYLHDHSFSNGHREVTDYSEQRSEADVQYIQARGNELRGAAAVHVKGQDDMILFQVAALFTGLNVCLMGKSAIGKTYSSSEVLAKLLGLEGQIFPLHPEVTVSEVTGYMRLDLETHKAAYYPGPFTGGRDWVVLDELNRASDKVQTGLLEVIDKKKITVDGETHSLSEAFTTLMTMNPPEADGTRKLIDALADRIDYVKLVGPPSKKNISRRAVATEIARYRHQKKAGIIVPPNPDQLWGSGDESRNIILQTRQLFSHICGQISEEVYNAAGFIYEHFSDPNFDTVNWDQPASQRTTDAIVDMATIYSILQRGQLPTPEDVGEVAPGCLMFTRRADAYMTTTEHVHMVKEELARVGDNWRTKSV